jgi:PST family polysaccharide transporter
MSIKYSFIKGVSYNAIGKYSNIIVNILIMAILARLLSPQEFGIVAISMVFILFFNMLGFVIQPAIIQNKNLSREELNVIFSFTAYIALFFSILFFFFSPIIADFYGEKGLIPINKLLSVSIFFNILLGVPKALKFKKQKFKEVSIIEISANLVGGLLAVILAYLDFSFYALVWKNLCMASILFVGFFLHSNLSFKFKLKKSSLLKIKEFSLNQFGVTVLNYFSRNTDNLLIGKFIGTSALGFYDKAYRLMLMPVQNLSHIISPVLHPILSEYEKEPQIIFNFYLKIVRILALISFPLSAFLFFSGNEIINIVYGPNWDRAIPVFQVLALTISIQTILSTNGSIFKALNKSSLMLKTDVVSAGLFVSGVVLNIIMGQDIVRIGVAILVAFILSFLYTFYHLIKIALGQSFMKFLFKLVYPLVIGLFIVLALSIQTLLFEINSLLLSLLVKIIISAAIFLSFIGFSKRDRSFLINILTKKE